MLLTKMDKLKLNQYRGIKAFNPAWQIVMQNDSHAPGSVDRVLLESAARICKETSWYLYNRFTPTRIASHNSRFKELEQHVKRIIANTDSSEARIDKIADFTQALGRSMAWSIDNIVLGGKEEEIISRGSDWCMDVTRVACALLQCSGIPSRIIYLFNTTDAYCGHVIVEAYRNGYWGAVDSSRSVVYRDDKGQPASTWKLMTNPKLIEAHQGKGRPYTHPKQFLECGVANYNISDRDKYDYTKSGVNSYQRSILEMSDKGWPGGFRWLHGEDKYAQPPASADAPTARG